MGASEHRKLEEQAFHDQLRGLRESDPAYGFYTSNKKFYSVARSSLAFVRGWLRDRCRGKTVLDYGSGNGDMSFFCAEHEAVTVGIDISETSVRNARAEAVRRGIADRSHFLVMDCEATGFSDAAFDVVCVSGVLHHLDLRRALAEIARVLRPGGEVICHEPLAHNPVFSWYRKMTPQLRTAWEANHLITRQSVALAREYFGRVESRCFHLTTLAAVPFRSLPIFLPLLSVLEKVDSMALTWPAVKWLAWQVVFTLSEPKRPA